MIYFSVGRLLKSLMKARSDEGLVAYQNLIHLGTVSLALHFSAFIDLGTVSLALHFSAFVDLGTVSLAWLKTRRRPRN